MQPHNLSPLLVDIHQLSLDDTSSLPHSPRSPLSPLQSPHSPLQSPHSPMSHPHSPRSPISQSIEILPNGKRVKTVGNYKLGKKLGRGSFCKVKLATHIQTGCKYAIKIMKPGDRKNSWDDIEREIRVLSGLRHPNIIGLHDILYTDATGDIVVGNPTCSLHGAKKLYLVVDLANNGELFDYIINKKRLSEDEARWMFRQIISAVEYLHAHCIAHRDLKPENILLDSNNTVKLNDFGLSNFVQPEKKMKTFCGSPVYAAPEVMRKSYYDGVIADVWSLGVILFTMVTGCLPWKLDLHTNRIENIEDMLEGRFDIPSVLSPECSALLCKMLIPDPAKRAKITEVRKHPWVNKGYLDYPPRFLEPNSPITEIDKVVLKQMEGMGFMQARVCQDVWGNKVKPSVTIYHTLLKRRNLLLLLNSTPSSQAQTKPIDIPSSPTKMYSPKASPTKAPPSWTPMETVYEEVDIAKDPHAPSSNTGSLPTSRSSLSRWIKDLTSVKTVTDVDFRENRVQLPTVHGISNFLKRRHSVPETQLELRTLHEPEPAPPTNSPRGNHSNSQQVPVTQTTPATNHQGSHLHPTSPKKEKPAGILQKIFSRRKHRSTVGVALPAA